MAKRGTKKPRRPAKTDRFALIEKSLRKQTKADLVQLILTIAKDHAAAARALESQLDIDKPVDLLVIDVSSAIDRATDFDDSTWPASDLDVDWHAYEDVQKGLRQLIKLGHLEDAKSLALKLMKEGSYQVEGSDEGLMTDEIEGCLRPIIRAVEAAGGDQAVKWAAKMQRADRVGFICDNELAEIANES